MGSGHPWWLYPQMGYHCWLCGKNSNSKKQWQQHIQSEKHKEKVFTSDSDASGWAYRFPMGEFRLCDRCRAVGWVWRDLAGCGVDVWSGPEEMEAVASTGSSWPGDGVQGVVCPGTAAPRCEEHQDGVGLEGWTQTCPDPYFAALGQSWRRLGHTSFHQDRSCPGMGLSRGRLSSRPKVRQPWWTRHRIGQ